MSEYKDFEEKSVDKAVEKACGELGLKPDKLRYDIISHGSSGIFGLVGAKRAVIRVWLPEGSLSFGAAAENGGNESGPDTQTEPRADTTDYDTTASALVDEAFGPSADEQEPPESIPSETEGMDPEIRQSVIDWTRGFIERFLALVSPDSGISVKEEGDVIRFEITGGDSARLIGKRGQTLDSLHYLVERGVYKQFGSSVPIEIDVEGYLEKRRTDLTELASRLAEKALQTGKPMVINRINSQDRRVVHLSLRENREVRTQSVGNGDLRKLLIMPKKKNQGKRQNPGEQ
ncbi:MAG: RNA-binding cell elongation regulator Jag/EloR [Thermodesulfobacteriota bacterium]